MSDEQKAKQSAIMKGRVLTPEHRAKVIQTLRPGTFNRGRRRGPWSDEVRARIGASGKGKHSEPWPVKGECVYCGGEATTRDHVIPKGRPGWEAPDNLVLACLPCNASKGPRTPEEWLAALTS
ncbi:MAG TPA: HNH endonuclease [Actinomycetota bacterium]